jgi:hypothetical protein
MGRFGDIHRRRRVLAEYLGNRSTRLGNKIARSQVILLARIELPPSGNCGIAPQEKAKRCVANRPSHDHAIARLGAAAVRLRHGSEQARRCGQLVDTPRR